LLVDFFRRKIFRKPSDIGQSFDSLMQLVAVFSTMMVTSHFFPFPTGLFYPRSKWFLSVGK
jgi:hypothetical protein